MNQTERKSLREVAKFAAVEGPYNSALFEATCAGARVNFRDLATPVAILSLLDDIEHLEQWRDGLFTTLISWSEQNLPDRAALKTWAELNLKVAVPVETNE